MPIEAILQTITRELRGCPFLKGIVLGGSRATGCASEGSDIDIGLYYEGIDYARLNAIAQRLDDAHRENLVCREGEWGNWVNCGGRSRIQLPLHGGGGGGRGGCGGRKAAGVRPQDRRKCADREYEFRPVRDMERKDES